LAKRILHERQTISGERRTVTVLFIDAAGSTAIGERLDPEELYDLTQDILQRMMDAVYTYEGHVAHFRGDGIMAIFGAPIAHEDSARRAVSAALEMQRALGECAIVIEGRLGVELSFRVGLNTGRVVVGHIGDDLAMEFTAMGDTVNLAARMEGAAAPGAVYVTADTYRAVRDYFELEPVGQLSLKGKQEPVQTYKILNERAIRTRFEVAAERGLTPYVGRQQELDLLRRDLERVKDGRGQVALISGEAGIGKSRLLLEFRRSAQDEVSWLEGQCISYGKHIPYRPIIDFVKDAFQIEESDSEARIIQRVYEATANWNQAAHAAVPYLKALLSVDPGDPNLSRMDPRDRRAGIFDGLQALLLQKSDDRPLVVVVEDLHWADEQSEAVLKALVDFIATAKVLLILTYRPDYAHSLGARSFFNQIALGDLTSGERLILAGNILQQARLPQEVATIITAKGEGNPFYIEEVTKSLVEAGILQEQEGNYALVEPLQRVQVPDTIQEVILSRIDRLDGEAKAALQLASVIGRRFTARLLDSISDLENELDAVLAELKDLELIYQESRYPELAYMFKHALTQDVAYQTLLRKQRRSLHRLIGAAIEELYADRLSEQFEMLAHHYDEGELRDEALIYLVKAGDKAAAAYANQDALDYYGRALGVCESPGSSALETIAQVARRRGVVNLSIADFEAAIADFTRVRDTARTLKDERLESMALFLRSLAEFEDHDPAATEESLRTALAIAGEQFADIRFVASSMLALALKTYNRHAEAKVAYEEAKKLAPKIDDPAKQLWWRVVGPLSLNWEGRFDEALAIHWRYDEDDAYTDDLHVSWNKGLALGGKGKYQQALDLLKPLLASCERIGEIYVRVRVLNTVGWIYGELQDHRQAMAWNKRGVQEAQEVGFSDPEVESNARLNLADNLMALGHLDEAREHLLFVERIVRQPRPQDHFSLWRYSQHHFHSYGELWLIQGEPDKALAYADECLALAETSESRKNIVKGRHLRGQAFLARGHLKEAERELTIALEVARQVGNPTQLWKTHETIGTLRTAEGRFDEAESAYQEAATVVQRVADNLSDHLLRDAFLASDAVQAIMLKAGKE
jgi:class 3 adenylate cyclase/tetratricopeptide (TPR) repeat protein